jgi:hypothetical protein
MSALMDSNPVLVQKLTTMGLEATYVTRLVNAGVTTMSRPSYDEDFLTYGAKQELPLSMEL